MAQDRGLWQRTEGYGTGWRAITKDRFRGL